MSKVLIDENNLTAIGNAIRSKNNSSTKYKPSDMANAINSIKHHIEYTTGDLQVVSSDAWSFKITQTNHQTITAGPSSKVVTNTDGTYSPAISADVTISPNTGYIPGAIQKWADKSTKTYNIMASAAEEIAGMVEDGWAKVYEDGASFYSDENYTTRLSSLSGDIVVVGMKNADASNTYFGSGALYNNHNLTKFKNTFITSAGPELLFGCTSITSVDLPNLTSAGPELLFGCTSITSVDLPNLTSAGPELLSGCTSITSVDLPNLTSAGYNLLSGCIKLKSIYLRSTIMCTLGGPTNLPPTVSIYVPASLIESYKTASNWSSYASKFKTLESIQLSKISIIGITEINMYNGNTVTYKIKYNDGDVVPGQTGVTWSITGNATISQDGIVTLNNASAGDTLSITAISTYDNSISASLTVSVVNKSKSIYIYLNDGQWVDSGTTVDGHTVYKSDAGSYYVDDGTSTCTVTVQGYSKVTVYARSHAENSYDYTEVGPLDGTVSRNSSSNVLSTKSKQSDTKYYSYPFTITDTNEHTFQVLYSKDNSGNSNDDRGYFYFVCE